MPKSITDFDLKSWGSITPRVTATCGQHARRTTSISQHMFVAPCADAMVRSRERAAS